MFSCCDVKRKNSTHFGCWNSWIFESIKFQLQWRRFSITNKFRRYFAQLTVFFSEYGNISLKTVTIFWETSWQCRLHVSIKIECWFFSAVNRQDLVKYSVLLRQCWTWRMDNSSSWTVSEVTNAKTSNYSSWSNTTTIARLYS